MVELENSLIVYFKAQLKKKKEGKNLRELV
jgi:hypothetical protein